MKTLQDITFLLIHGNSGSTIDDYWFPYVKKELQQMGCHVIAETFPDNDLARGSYWLPFIEDKLQGNPHAIVIGHSSGAIAAMRYAETNPLLGSVLVAGYHTDLGMPKEKESSYFDKPWDWNAIKKNQQWIIQFSSVDDPWIPIEEPRFIRDKLNTIYLEYNDMGHFGGDYNKREFPELVSAVKRKLPIHSFADHPL